MQRFLAVRRPSGPLERVLGPRRLRRLRRRAGLAALGTGFLLLRPRWLRGVVVTMCAVTTLAVMLAASR